MPHPYLELLLGKFRARFAAVARRWYPSLAAYHDDCIQRASVKLVSLKHLEQVENPARVERWATKIVRNELRDEARRQKIDRERREFSPPNDDDAEDFLERLAARELSGRSPEEMAALREAMDLVIREIAGCEVSKKKWILGLSDKEIADQLQLTSNQVRGRLKRMRQRIRKLLDSGEPSPTQGRRSKRRRTKQ